MPAQKSVIAVVTACEARDNGLILRPEKIEHRFVIDVAFLRIELYELL